MGRTIVGADCNEAAPCLVSQSLRGGYTEPVSMMFEETQMELGDTVKIKTTGRYARIVGALTSERFQVEYLPDPNGDPLDRDTVQSEQEEGIYAASELETLE